MATHDLTNEAKRPDEVVHRNTENKGVFMIRRDGHRVAEMTYSKAGETMIIIDHTEIDESLRGTGAGLRLLTAAVEWARANSIQVMATCPFAIATFRKHPELRDVYVGG